MERSYWIALVVLSAMMVTPANARPAHKQSLAQYFGAYLSKKLNDCRTCHLPDATGQDKDDDVAKLHNAFGAQLKTARQKLRQAGKSATIEACLEAILDRDSDGDGVSNRVEILTGHRPGDRDDRPSADELAKAKTLIVEFAKLKSGYPWRPYDVVTRPSLPQVKNTNWLRNPIDAFIAAEHDALGLAPLPEAPPEVLLRRVHLDLIGLPPTPDEIDAFRKDCANATPPAMSGIPDSAWNKVVDRLLNDPRHGERWGRHWMDVWRYSDWAGFGPQIRDSQPHIWRWRDWIIDSINADKGYDRMILEMLAGDELAPEDPKILAATGYLVRNWKLLSREKWIQDTVEHTSQAFLGITLQCAKCHDHMYDPILQTDYYQFRAIFEPHDVRIDRLPGQPDTKIDGLPRVYDKNLSATTFLFLRGDDRTPDKKPLAPAVPEAIGGLFPKVQSVTMPNAAVTPDKRPFVVKEMIESSAREIAKVSDELAKLFLELQSLEQPIPPEEVKKAIAAKSELQKTLEVTLVAKQCAHDALAKTLAAEKLEDAGQMNSDTWKQTASAAFAAQRLAELSQAKLAMRQAEVKLATSVVGTPPAIAAMKSLADATVAFNKATNDMKQPAGTNYKKRTLTTYPPQSTGRRLALARWLACKDNPLTARVAVNHIWLRHFGQAIVPTVSDFGKNGRPATHPALLDWLAAEFMQPTVSDNSQNRDGVWSMRHLHRLIVTSSTYRMASTPSAANTNLDRDNKYLWRYPPHRLEAEAVRDSLFHVAGKLDPAMGGPEIDHPLGLTVPRRSLYFRHAAEKEMEFLTIFDSASVTECYERKQSIVPQQALALFNSELSLKHARILARMIAGKSNGDATAFTQSAFMHVLSRQPTLAETADCVAFLQEQTRRLQVSKTPGNVGITPDGTLPAPDPALRARENLVHVLLNHHEFVTIR